MRRNNYGQEEDDDYSLNTTESFRLPDRDVYRKTFTTFGSVQNYYENILNARSSSRERYGQMFQPHYSSLKQIQPPFANILKPADGICAYFLRRGVIKPQKTQMTSAVWSADTRWLVLGTVTGSLALWKADSLVVEKITPIPACKSYNQETGDHFLSPVTAMCWNNYGNLLVTGDGQGVIQYMDEAFHEVFVMKEAHTEPVRGLSYSPLDSKLVSCSDDNFIHIWSASNDKPEMTLTGHQMDVKCVDWHPYRALIASGSRDSSVKLWDPKTGNCLSTLAGHKKQVNNCIWNQNGNWLATGSKDGLIKIYDIRMMKEIEILKGHNYDVTSMAWHPQHESLLLSGGYDGSLIYWLVGGNQAPHTIIADAHKQSIDVIKWHPHGHCVSTASHDGILKFWCREPPGAVLDDADKEKNKEFQNVNDNPIYNHGPLNIGAPSIIPLQPLIPVEDRGGSGQPNYQPQYQPNMGRGGHGVRFAPNGGGGRGFVGGRGDNKRPRYEN